VLHLPRPRAFTSAQLIATSLAFFIISLFIGVWTAYDRSSALQRASILALGLTLVVFPAWLVRRNQQRVLKNTAILCGLLSFLLGLDYLLFDHFSGNVIATAQIILLPLATAGAYWAIRRRYRRESALAMAGVLVGLAALLAADERSAWLGLVGGMVGAALLYERVIVLRKLSRVWVIDLLAVVVGLMLLAGLWATLRSPAMFARVTSILGKLGTHRLDVWDASLALINDYLFTGSGLGASPMVFSTYAFLYHVPFLYHTHNIYLQIWLEQGVLGLVAFLGLLAGSIWGIIPALSSRSKSIRALAVGALVSLLAMALAGVANAELYVSMLAPIVFLPIGFTLALEQMVLGSGGSVVIGRRDARSSWWMRVTIGLVLAVVILAATLPLTRARFLANLGAVTQTRAELSVYSWPNYSIQDEVRRSPAVNLNPAIDHYQAAITLDPGNVTAQRRWGQILLSQGKYDAAREHLELAYANTHPYDRITHILLGEAYAVTGDVAMAVKIWKSAPPDGERLRYRHFWYENISDAEEANRIEEAITLILHSH